ncbi:hypothetical protein ACSBR1_004533 [Camellia fascicularis]
MTNSGIHKNKNNVKEKRQLKTALFVKVNMDGIPIGRKVDLNAHKHWRICSVDPPQLSVIEAHNIRTEATGPPSKLLDGSSEFCAHLCRQRRRLGACWRCSLGEMRSLCDEKRSNLLERWKIWTKNSST